MANDLNQCNFIGRLGRDPETRYMPDGTACTNFSIAIGSSWTDKASGEKKEHVEWVRCTAWRKLGEICGEYLKKGSQVYVEGSIQTRKWQDKDGQDKYTTEIVGRQMQMLGSREGGAAPRQAADALPDPMGIRKPAAAASHAVESGPFAGFEDDIPF